MSRRADDFMHMVTRATVNPETYNDAEYLRCTEELTVDEAEEVAARLLKHTQAVDMIHMLAGEDFASLVNGRVPDGDARAMLRNRLH